MPPEQELQLSMLSHVRDAAASMEHPLLLQHMQQKQHAWKAARVERKQQLDAKNSSRSLLMLKNPPDPNKRQKVTNR